MKVFLVFLILSSPCLAEEKEHKVYDQGGLSKFHRITKNEKAIVELLKEVQILKKEIQLLKKAKSVSAPAVQEEK